MATLPKIDQIWNGMKSLLPRTIKKGARAFTKTFNPQSRDGLVDLPTYNQHLTDLFASRIADDSRTLMRTLFKHDPDVSAAVGAYLTLADTPMSYLVRNHEGEIDAEATKTLNKLVRALTSATDYTKGFIGKPGLARLNQELRYMTLLRGAIGGELVFDKMMVPTRINNIDMADVEWLETESGDPKPRQAPANSQDKIDLDIPSFFVSFHRRDPTTLYTNSDFVSAINTIAARQQVINDLYRIMQVTGFPRIHIKVVEEVVAKSAPANLKDDPNAYRQWLTQRLAEIKQRFASLRADQSFVSFDSVEASVINEKNPGAGIDISKVIEVLNGQNQAALKTMATIIGRGNQGTNTASVEARIAAMNADQINVPLKEFWERLLTFLVNIYGILGYVEVNFAPAELRPHLELETQRTLLQARLLTDLSLGTITDEEYHLKMHGRLAPAGAPMLSGTGFQEAVETGVDASDVSPNEGGLSRAMVPEGAKSAKSNAVKKKKTKASSLVATLISLLSNQE